MKVLKESLPIILIAGLVTAFFSLSLCGCGDGLHVDTNGSQGYAYPNQAQRYDECLKRNPNYFGSPAWYYWVDQCKKLTGVSVQGYPSYNGQPTVNN